MSASQDLQRVLVTGGRGLLGSHLVPLLARCGDRVRVLSRTAEAIEHAGEILRGDLRDAETIRTAVRGVSAVYHLAAVTRKWLPDRRRFDETNVDAAIQLVRCAAEAGVERIVHVSSFTVFGPSPSDGRALDETAPLPVTLQNDYQRSKQRAHRQLLELAAREGLPVVIACPGVLYGAADPRHVNPVSELVHQQLGGRLRAFPTGGTRIWTLSYLPDVARGLRLACQHGRPGETYNLGGAMVPLREVFAWVKEQSGCAPPPLAPPLWPFVTAGRAVELGARLLGRTPRMTASALRFLAHDWCFSSSKAIADLGYRITPLQQALTAIWTDLHERELVPQAPPAALPAA